MSRRRCCGLIEDLPVCRRFCPESQPDNRSVVIGLEEMEAIRLKDVEGLEQAQCAKSMGLSRSTFQRLLQSARNKIATALVNGMTILIEGGNYQVKNRVFECVECGQVWEVEPCTAGGRHGYEIACPKCGSLKKMKLEDGVKHVCGGQGHSSGHGGCCHGH